MQWLARRNEKGQIKLHCTPYAMPILYSYVVDHDRGLAPHAKGRYCSLVHCKFGGVGSKRNIVELAEVGDWIIGTGGQSRSSAGNGRIIYIMRVDEKMAFEEYLEDRRFKRRADCVDRGHGNQFALVSRTFWYFGRSAIPVAQIPRYGVGHSIEKKGPGFRSDFTENFIERLVNWFERNYSPGIHDEPCRPGPAWRKASARCGKRSLAKSKRCGADGCD